MKPPPDFGGVFRTDAEAVGVYAEAAGIQRAVPRAVAVPRDAADVQAIVSWARDAGTPLIPRGSGSSMAGGAVGDGVIVDLSRLKEIGEETNSVNKALSRNPVADRIICYETLYRKHPAGCYEFPFSEMVLPAAFTGGKAHWPRS